MMLPQRFRVFVSHDAVDFRRSFSGLCGVIRDVLGQDPQSPTLFVFRNRRSDQIKIMWWDSNGYAIWMKRLCEGTFSDLSSGELDSMALARYLELIKVKK